MVGIKPLEPDESEFVEVDPTGRYGRYDEILGKGASKTVYRAFDEFQGIEVAWNQVKLYDFLQSPEDLERLYCEIHLLKTLKHKNIMKFYTSWVDTANRNINFVTEMFTSGTLRQYRQKHKRVNIRAVKHWCRQILKGLLYLHSHDPPVIHRDLKCDNIFVNGNQGEVKIGDLGLAAILRKSHAAHCVGTPEFMAPEVYKEEYNELVDIYSFGMCILEMVTFEYPYSECTHPAQIYKKVISGKKPDALYKVKDPEVRQFVEKCLAAVSMRLPARELLKDPFLQIDDCGVDLRPIEYLSENDETGPLLKQPPFLLHHTNSSSINGYSSDHDLGLEYENGWMNHPVEMEHSYHEDEHSSDVDITIEGKRGEDDSILLRLRIADKEGYIRNIYFPFDIENDTALSVATEMIAELDLTDQDVTKIADTIDGEIACLVPEWNPGPGMVENPQFTGANYSPNCTSDCISDGSLMGYLSLNNASVVNLPVQCSVHESGAMYGRFEEVTYQVEESEHCAAEEAPTLSSQSDGIQHTDIWIHHEGPGSGGSMLAHSDEENSQFHHLTYPRNDMVIDKNVIEMANHTVLSPECTSSDDYENEIRQELRWLKAKYQMELRELKCRRLGGKLETSIVSPSSDNRKKSTEHVLPCSLATSPIQGENDELLLKSFALGNHFPAYLPCHFQDTQKEQSSTATNGSFSPEDMLTAKNFYAGALLPQSLHRTTSLPVDSVNF